MASVRLLLEEIRQSKYWNKAGLNLNMVHRWLVYREDLKKVIYDEPHPVVTFHYIEAEVWL